MANWYDGIVTGFTDLGGAVRDSFDAVVGEYFEFGREQVESSAEARIADLSASQRSNPVANPAGGNAPLVEQRASAPAIPTSPWVKLGVALSAVALGVALYRAKG